VAWGMVARLRSRLSEALNGGVGELFDWGDYGHGGGH